MARSSFSRLLLLATVAFTALIAVNGTQVMHRPAQYKDALRQVKTEATPKTNVIQKRAANKVSFAYFTNWGIYGANFRAYIISILYAIFLISVIYRTHGYRNLQSYTFVLTLLYFYHSLTFLQTFSTLSPTSTPVRETLSSLIPTPTKR